MYKLFIICLAIIASSFPVFPGHHAIICDLAETTGKLVFIDGFGESRKINVGKDANTFDPSLCPQGLYPAYFVADAKKGPTGKIYLLVDSKLPAGFATIISHQDKDSYQTYVNFYEANDNLTVKYQPWDADEFAIAEAEEGKPEYIFAFENYVLEIRNTKGAQDYLVKKLLVEKNNLGVLQIRDYQELSYFERATRAATKKLTLYDGYVTEWFKGDEDGLQERIAAQQAAQELNATVGAVKNY